MTYRFKKVRPSLAAGSRPSSPARRDREALAAVERAAEQRVALALTERFAWFLSPLRLNALAEDLRVLQRNRALDLGLVVISVILSALSRSSDTEGRVREAFAVYRQIDAAVDVTDEAFRKAMGRSAVVLQHLLQRWMRELTKIEAWAPLRGRLAFFKDLRLTDSTCFKRARSRSRA
jgi:hypothetical protein